jgi:putative methyltransferase
MRINTLKSSRDKVVKQLQGEGWRLLSPAESAAVFEAAAAKGPDAGLALIPRDAFGEDPLVGGLLFFRPGTNLHGHPLVKSGALISQDRASCLSAVCLLPMPAGNETHAMDATSAPGNKTTHVAALIGRGPHAKVFAFDRDPESEPLARCTTPLSSCCVVAWLPCAGFKTLQRMVRAAGATHVQCTLSDFRKVDPQDKR